MSVRDCACVYIQYTCWQFSFGRVFNEISFHLDKFSFGQGAIQMSYY